MKKLLFFLFLIPVFAFGQTADYTSTSSTDLNVYSVNDKTLVYEFYDTLSGSNDTLIISFPKEFPAGYTATLGSTWVSTGTTTDSDVFLQGRNASHETWTDLGTTTFAAETTTAYSDGIDVSGYIHYRIVCVSASGSAHLKNSLVLKKKSSSAAAGGGAAYIEVTYAAAAALNGAGGLVPGTIYNITDRGDRGIFLTAISENKFASIGQRLMLCPKTYATITVDGNTWLGIWTSTLTPATGNYCIWGAHVWRNVDGAVGSSSGDLALDADWVKVGKDTFSDNEYIEKVFYVEYDFENDWIGIQRDDRGNQFGAPYISGSDNYSDLSDWNFVTKDDAFSNNECLFFLNNRIDRAHGNKLTGSIYYGIKNNITVSITENTCEGSIDGNIVGGSIFNNSNIDDIIDNDVTGDIAYNSCGGGIEENIGPNDIMNNSNTLGIASNVHDGDIIYNRNNGYIQNCTGSSGFSVQNNTNNGNINNPAGLSSGNITDTIVNK